MRQFQVLACVLFNRPYDEDELFDEPLPDSGEAFDSDDGSDPEEGEALSDEPLIGYYTTRYVSAQSVAEAVHYVEEALTTDDEFPESRIFDLSCTEVQFHDLEQEIREDSRSPDIPGIWYEEGMGFFSQIEIERPHLPGFEH